MKRLVLVAALVAAPLATANELDRQAVSADQIEKSKGLPGTTVIRISQTDPNDVSVAYVQEKLKPGQKGQNLVFEKVALNTEKTGIAFSSKNELDKQSSTSSWVVGWRGGYGRGGFIAGGNRGYYGGGYGGYGYNNGYYGNGYGYNTGYYGGGYGGYGYSNYNNCGSYCYPQYAYANYNYGYTPYYAYTGYGYNYYNCGWVY
jgi:hypothetical protein